MMLKSSNIPFAKFWKEKFSNVIIEKLFSSNNVVNWEFYHKLDFSYSVTTLEIYSSTGLYYICYTYTYTYLSTGFILTTTQNISKKRSLMRIWNTHHIKKDKWHARQIVLRILNQRLFFLVFKGLKKFLIENFYRNGKTTFLNFSTQISSAVGCNFLCGFINYVDKMVGKG